MQPTLESIDDVLKALDGIIDTCMDRGSRIGYFAALYRKVTARVKKGIEEGEFENGSRMEELDICFAKRYVDAYFAYQRGELPTRVWLAAFQAAEDPSLLVVQHLLLGMNAHINLDLGVAAARVAPGPSLSALETDFNRINQLLAELSSGVKLEMEQTWPPLRALDALAGTLDDAFINFSMSRARKSAWKLAQSLAPLPTSAQLPKMAEADTVASALASAICHPPFTESILLSIRHHERGDVRTILQRLL